MKISEMTNDQAADALVKMMPAVTNIINDKKSKELLQRLTVSEGMSNQEVLTIILPEVLGYCLKSHKEDTYAIIAALTMKPVSHIGKMNFIQTVKEVKDSIDKDLLDFFKSAGNSTENPGKS